VLFVPVVPPQPPSPRTRELADLLTRAIEEYEKYHPGVSGQEVRAALQLAARSSRKAGPDPRMVGAATALAVLLSGFVVVALKGGDAGVGPVPIVAMALAVFAVVFTVALLIRHGRR
jgi:hypothetical protein